MKRAIVLLSFVMLVCGVFSVALAGEGDNLCHTEWAGQCHTLRHWEAGWCFANYGADYCSQIYADVVSPADDDTTGSGQSGGQVQESSLGAQNQQQSGFVIGPQKQSQQQQSQQQSQQSNCTPSISFSGYSNGTYNFSVSRCGIPLSAGGSWPSGVDLGQATGSNSGDECTVALWRKTDAYGDPSGHNQLYWSVYDNCYDGDSVSVSG